MINNTISKFCTELSSFKYDKKPGEQIIETRKLVEKNNSGIKALKFSELSAESLKLLRDTLWKNLDIQHSVRTSKDASKESKKIQEQAQDSIKKSVLIADDILDKAAKAAAEIEAKKLFSGTKFDAKKPRHAKFLINLTKATSENIRKTWVYSVGKNDQQHREHIKHKWHHLVKTLKPISKGATHKEALILQPSQWLEVLKLKLHGEKHKKRYYSSKLKDLQHMWDKDCNKKGEKYSSIMSFQEFMKKVHPKSVGSHDKHKLSKSKMTYLTHNDDRKKHKVRFKGKHIYMGKKDLSDGLYMFLITPDRKKMYIGKKEKGHFHHSSFLAGGACAAVGMMTIKNRKIVEITNESGHYRGPSEIVLKVTKEFLKDKSRLGKHASDIKFSKWR
jgi:hypothetical protein